MSEEKHTPLPWRVEKARTLLHILGEGPICSISVSANHVYEDFPGCKAQYIATQEANAALIVRSVNALPALVKALEEIIAADQKEKLVTIECDPAGNTMAVEMVDGPSATIARAALASVRGDK